MSFKKNSDDLRESPFIELIEFLYSNGVCLHIYDPDVNKEQLSKSKHLNQFLLMMNDNLDLTLEGM